MTVKKGLKQYGYNDPFNEILYVVLPLSLVKVVCFTNQTKRDLSFFSRAMGNRIMDHMPNLLLLIAVTLRQHQLLEATLSRRSSSMDLHMPSRQQVSY